MHAVTSGDERLSGGATLRAGPRPIAGQAREVDVERSGCVHATAEEANVTSSMMTGSTSMRPLQGWFPRQRARRLAASFGCLLALLSCAQAASATEASNDRYISGAAFQEFG